MVTMKVMKQVNRSVEAMRTKISMESNVIWNLPKACPHLVVVIANVDVWCWVETILSFLFCLLPPISTPRF
ncbi:hypothetical protein NC652_023779 [Populus alba x Populus x berolinensis]|nr:hypothetical protein NC652_023779 [Populus alba x Populus x berolinensis]